jgi:hypothetical protein
MAVGVGRTSGTGRDTGVIIIGFGQRGGVLKAVRWPVARQSASDHTRHSDRQLGGIPDSPSLTRFLARFTQWRPRAALHCSGGMSGLRGARRGNPEECCCGRNRGIVLVVSKLSSHLARGPERSGRGRASLGAARSPAQWTQGAPRISLARSLLTAAAPLAWGCQRKPYRTSPIAARAAPAGSFRMRPAPAALPTEVQRSELLLRIQSLLTELKNVQRESLRLRREAVRLHELARRPGPARV